MIPPTSWALSMEHGFIRKVFRMNHLKSVLQSHTCMTQHSNNNKKIKENRQIFFDPLDKFMEMMGK